MENRQNRKNSKRAEDYWDSAHKRNCGTIVERYLEDEQNRKRMHEQGCTRTDMKEFDTIALERKSYVTTFEERRDYRDQYTVMQPNPGWSGNTAKTEEHTEYQQIVQWKRWNLTCHSQNPDAEQWSSWSPWTWSPSTRSSWWDSSSHSWRQSPLSTQPNHATLLSNRAPVQKPSTGRPGALRPISECFIFQTCF